MRLRLGLALLLAVAALLGPVLAHRAAARAPLASPPGAPQAAGAGGIALDSAAALALAQESNPQIDLARLALESTEAVRSRLPVSTRAGLVAYLKKRYGLAQAEGSADEAALVTEQADLSVTQAQAALDAARRAVRLQLVGAYAGVVRQDALLEAAIDARLRAQSQQAVVQAAFDAGTATAADRLAAEAQAGAAQARVQAAAAQRAAAAAALARAAGLSQGAPLTLVNDLPDGSGPAPDLDDALRRASTQRFELAEARWALESAQVDLRLAGRYPDADLATLQRAVDEASLRLSLARQEIELQVRQAYYGWLAAQARLSALPAARTAAQAAADVAQVRFAAGTATYSEVVAAAAGLTQAEADLIQARADLWQAQTQIESARGD